MTVDPPQPVDVHFWVAGTSDEFTFSSEDIRADHTVMLWMMKANTSYDWRASPRLDPTATATGSFTTGPLDPGCDVGAVTTGTASFPYFITQSPCVTNANLVVMDAAGDVLWCEDFTPGTIDPMMEGYTFTEDGTLLAVLADTIIEKDFYGNELLRLTRNVDFANHVHHDVFRKNGLTYLLFNEVVTWNYETYTLDGFYVFDGTTQVGEWHLIDHWQPTQPASGWPGQDYTHGNAVWVDDNLDLLISMRHISAFASVNADPNDPLFGEFNYRVAGTGLASEFMSDYSITSSVAGAAANFEKQHNVHVLPSGQIAMFDNRAALAEMSRVIHLSLDPVLGEADITDVYELPVHCDFQGGAWHAANGNPVATCAPQQLGYEWDLGSSTTRWTVDLSCNTGLPTYTPRFTPWDGPF